MIVFYLLIIVLVALKTTCTSTCLDEESCAQLHLNNTPLNLLLEERCKHSAFFTSASKKLTVTHIPKAGGSSLYGILQKFVPGRFSLDLHEAYYVQIKKHPQNLLIAQFREPASRAISLYNYINKWPKVGETGNTMWKYTYQADPGNWSSSPYVQKFLEDDVLAFFLPDITNVSESITTYHSWKAAQHHQRSTSLPQLSQHTTFDTFKSYLKYKDTIPTQFQCTKYLKVGYILISQYAVVGTLEHRDKFLKVLFRRANVNESALSVALGTHKNQSPRYMTTKNMELVRENLSKPFYCSRVLWRLVQLVNNRDLECMNISKSIENTL